MGARGGTTRRGGDPDERGASGSRLTRDQRRGVVVGAVVGLVLGLLFFGGDGRSFLTTAALAVVVVAIVAATVGYYVRPVRGRR